MMLPTLFLLAQADVPATRPVPTGQDGRRIAIVIGNNAYSRKPLANGVREAAEMQTTLSSLGFETVLLANAGLSELQFAFFDVAAGLTAGDMVVVYFHGYAMQIDGDNLLLPIDFKASNKTEAKENSYSAALLPDDLNRASLCLLILDPGGDQPFGIDRERPIGLARMKPRKNVFVAFGTAPGKAPAPATAANGLFGRFLREGLRQPSIGLDKLLSVVRSKVEEASGHQQVPWTAAGSRDVADAVLHTVGSGQAVPGNAGVREPFWNQVRDRIQRSEQLLPQRRSARDLNRGEALAQLDAEYGHRRTEAARAAQKDEFETTTHYLARTTETRAEAAKIEERYKAESDRLDTLFKDSTGDPDLRALEALKTRRFRGPCKAQWVEYDADRQTLTLYVGGSGREFEMAVTEAKTFKPRSSKLTCEGGFSPETVTVSDPAGFLNLIERRLEGLRTGAGEVTAPRLVSRVEPEFPGAARKARLRSVSVILKILVDEKGVPRSIRPVRSDGFGTDEAAISAVRKWRFQPGTKNGEPVVTVATVEVNFRLL